MESFQRALGTGAGAQPGGRGAHVSMCGIDEVTGCLGRECSCHTSGGRTHSETRGVRGTAPSPEARATAIGVLTHAPERNVLALCKDTDTTVRLSKGLCHGMREVCSVRHDAGRLSKSRGHHAIPRRKTALTK